MSTKAWAAVLVAWLGTGCVSWQGDGGRFRGEEMARRAELREWQELKVLKATQQWQLEGAETIAFPGHGEVTVRAWFLEGWPGTEHVRAKLTWENTTGQRMERVDVTLAVQDAQGRLVSAGRVRLTHPWGLPLAPNTFFADEIAVPTLGAHWQRGWRWTLACKATPDPDGPRIAALAD